MSRTIVAVYEELSNPDQLRRELEAIGIDRSQFRISSDTEGSQTRTTTDEPRGFLAWLFGAPEEEVTYYRQGLERGRIIVSVRANEGEAVQVTDILERYDPIDIDRERGGVAETGAVESDVAETEARIPVAEEELRVGKRDVERGRVRVRSYVVEEPVEGQVNLREEAVRVERRPASGMAQAGGDAFQERSVEVTQHAEEPVVEKTARVKEEVVVKKDVEERTERVRDKVRRTEVEVEDTRQPESAGPARRR